jgi:beta-glucanase (GH16 family)
MGLINNFVKHKISDSFVNLKTNLVNRLKISYGKPILPPQNYSEVFSDEFNSPLDKNKWRYGQPWGEFHPNDTHQYYDNDGTLSYVSPQGLVLELRKKPKTFFKRDLPDWLIKDNLPDEINIPVGVGMVTTKNSWRYGWFEGWIQLPKGQSYWNAFWLTALKTWPPEIDIFEGYSEEGPEYSVGGFKNRKIQPNLHYGVVENGTKKMYSPFNNTVRDVTERFVQYVCHWEKDFIRIYYG